MGYGIILLYQTRMAHTGGMRSIREFREAGGANLESRILECPDGVARLLPLPPRYWQELYTLLVVDTPSLDEILCFILQLSEQSVIQEDWEHETAFRELFMYYIYGNYRSYLQVRYQLANDNIEPWFAHFHEQART
jgi:hypothetical protein